MENRPTVFVVDDDRDVRRSLRWLFESTGMSVEDYPTAETFLAAYHTDRSGCLVLDVRMPGMGGFGLLRHFAENWVQLPVIVLTGHGDVPMAVRALKLGAVDFVQKPFNHQQLLELVREALERDAHLRSIVQDQTLLLERWRSLTGREREVLEKLVDGDSNKVISSELGISQRTVETHRAKIMEKMGVRSLAVLIRVALVIRKLA